jgi:thioredoxin reductase
VSAENLDAEVAVSALQVRHTATHRERRLPVTGVFVAIGHDPASDLFRGQVALDQRGYVRTSHRSTRTNLDGVFAAGDLADPGRGTTPARVDLPFAGPIRTLSQAETWSMLSA